MPTMINKLTLEILTDKSFETLLEELAKYVHNRWMAGRISDGWQYGPTRSDEKKEHPSLITYEELSEAEKEYDRQTVKATLTYLIENGFEIVKKDEVL